IQDNASLALANNGAYVMKGNELLVCAPKYTGEVQTDATSIAAGAFAGNANITSVKANNVEKVGAYAFADCKNLATVQMSAIRHVGDYAFMNTALTETPNLNNIETLGKYAFAGAKIGSITVGNGGIIGEYAFADNASLTSVTLGDNVTVGTGAFSCSMLLLGYDQTENLSNYTQYDYVIELIDGGTEVHSYYKYNFEKGVRSNLTTLTIGKDANIGTYAFAGNAKLQSVTLGEGARIGDYAFYNNGSLKTIDLSKAKEIGDYAFSGTVEFDKERVGLQITDAMLVETYNGQYLVVGNAFTAFAPQLETVDLSSAVKVGKGAFANCNALKSVKFSSALTEIGAYAFQNCGAITAIALPESVSIIGDAAFYGVKVTTVDLSKVSSIGNFAFARTALETVVLKAGATLGDGAFAYCVALDTVTNLQDVNSIGAHAFDRTALVSVTFESVTAIGDYAFKDSKVTEVNFGTAGKLATLGENPFANCQIETFAKEENVYFPENVVVGTQESRTYDVSETVKVINEVLYQVVPNGLELISYPMAKDLASFVVEEGTVRISANAFAGATIQDVTLASTLKAVGDKAFYGCEKLSVVVFKSYDAPVLEEQYDESYMLYTNLPYEGKTNGFDGLGISKYYMWNTSGSMFYYGANFVNYIGKVNTNLVMVKPANGQNYGSFIFGQYFTKTVEGSNAATADTLSVIEMIAALPDNVTLADENAVVAARKAYDAIPLLEQKALVDNYAKLTEAEATIVYLKLREEKPEDPTDKVEKQPSKFVEFLKKNYVSLIIAGVSILGSAAFVVTTAILRKKKDKTNTEEETETEETSENENVESQEDSEKE
ncbi:MAG: leucine-rich repeat domain-containing protein, partial [Clostridia bacterium]|nr:leucine-rich repeat domain-containing protein [Clostridia bacterium]